MYSFVVFIIFTNCIIIISNFRTFSSPLKTNQKKKKKLHSFFFLTVILSLMPCHAKKFSYSTRKYWPSMT